MGSSDTTIGLPLATGDQKLRDVRECTKVHLAFSAGSVDLSFRQAVVGDWEIVNGTGDARG
jgi:hypothetical protein